MNRMNNEQDEARVLRGGDPPLGRASGRGGGSAPRPGQLPSPSRVLKVSNFH